MALVQNPRVMCGKILQNHNGQYFFVCSTCDLEFVTLSTFLNHQNDGHDSKEFQMQSDDLTIPFIKNPTFGRKTKEPEVGSKDLAISFASHADTVHELRDDKNSSDSTEDCSEPVHKIKAVLRTVSKAERRHVMLVSPKAKTPVETIFPVGTNHYDSTVPFTKRLNFGRKTKESNDLTTSLSDPTETIHEVKDDKDSSDSMDDCSEPVHKIKAAIRTVPKFEPRRTILTSPKAKKPARNNSFAPFGNYAKSTGGGRTPPVPAVRTTEEISDKYKCKNCSATFSTMVNLDSHEIVCMLLPMRFYCDRCNYRFDDKNRLQTHNRICHRT